MTPAARPSIRAERFVTWILRHGRALWIAALVLAVPASLRTATLYLHLRTSIEELLPRAAPSVLAVEELRARVPGLSHLGVVVDVGDAARMPAGERLVDDLAARIRAYPPDLVLAVRTGDAEERRFLERTAPLGVDLEDLRAIRARIEARRNHEVEKQLGTLLDDEPAPPLDFSDLEAKYRGRLDEIAGRFPRGRFSSPDLHLTMLVVDVGEAERQGRPAALLGRVKADLAALGGSERYAPGMRVGYAGDVAITVEETEALMNDLSVSSVLVIFAVVAALVAYYRWWRSVLVLLPPLLLAASYAFALASLPPFGVTALNSNTAFLGSIIAGNGINFGIVLLARYVEARRAGALVEGALVTAVAGAFPGTVAAALAAGAAYASLGITDFRGFRQFGCIGGLGMVLAWILAFTLMPPLAAWLDRGRGALGPAPASASRRSLMAPLGRFIVAWPVAITTAAALLTIVAAAEVRTFGPKAIEYDFSRLRRADTWTRGEGYWGRKMEALLGAYLTPMAVLTDGADEARAVAETLRAAAKRPPLDERIATVRTLDDLLPPDQIDKIAELAAIRRLLTPRLRALVPEDKRAMIDRLVGAGDLRPVTVADLPSTFLAGIRERDGAVGRIVLVFPRPSRALWVGPKIVALSHALRAAAAVTLPGRRPARVAGALEISADIFEALGHDGPLVTGAAFLGVAMVVVVVFRRSAVSAYVLGALLVGVLWLGGLAMALHVRLNFANFIAFPITFGIGVDYPVNVMSRFEQDGGRDVAGAIRSTGGAVGLCSLTTIIGYSSLLLAQNRALCLFGALAVLGEISCLLTAVVALPALLQWREGRRTLAPDPPPLVDAP